MKIIVESGATKSDWRVIDAEGRTVSRTLHPGMNVSSMPADEVEHILKQAIEDDGIERADGFYMYTAGVVTDTIRASMEGIISSLVNCGDIDIQNDLTGAARGACGHSAGIVAILGTGSNTCFYDGSTVIQKVRSGGYVLGDEGSASALGKIFLCDLLKGLVPEELASEFGKSFDASYEGIVGNVYHSPSPAAYLGSLAPFILSHYESDGYIKGIVDANFRAFIERALSKYDTAKYGVGVVGGFGSACRDIFSRIAADTGIRITGYIPEPVEGLVKYHK